MQYKLRKPSLMPRNLGKMHAAAATAEGLLWVA